jgi:hypothetical protein
MSDQLVLTESSHGARRVIMNAGANALDLDLLQGLRDAVGELREDGAPPVALCSADPRLFSPGWNLKRLAGASRREVHHFLARFNATVYELFSYPGMRRSPGCSLTSRHRRDAGWHDGLLANARLTSWPLCDSTSHATGTSWLDGETRSFAQSPR